MEHRPSSTRQAADQLPLFRVPNPHQAAPTPLDVDGRQKLAVRAEDCMGMPVIAPVRPRQTYQISVVVQPAHDHLAGALHESVPVKGGIDGNLEDIAAVALPPHPKVNEPQGGDRMVANLGQSPSALGVCSEDLRGTGEPVQALEPLSDQPGALQGRAFGDQRPAQRQPGIVLGMLGAGKACPGQAVLEPKLVALTIVYPRRCGRDDRGDGCERRRQGVQEGQAGVALAPPPEPLVSRYGSRPDRPVLQETPQLGRQLVGRGEPVGRVLGQRLLDDRLQVARDTAVELPRRGGRLVHDLVDQAQPVSTLKQRAQRQ